MNDPGEPRAVVLFDGVCNLCNASVLFVIDRDPAGYFAFLPLQGSEAQRYLERHGCGGGADLSSIVLIEGGRCFRRSTAALRVARRLTGAWPLLYGFLVVPAPVRDFLYAWIAHNRYRWFGRAERCRIASPELQSRFLSPDPSQAP
jgi:predicted DCC family thiol-disulfide oxidoreductase YuxK